MWTYRRCVYLDSQNKCCCRQTKSCVRYTATSSLPSNGHVVCLPYFHVGKGRPGERSPSFGRPEPSHRLTCCGTTETPGRIGFRRLSSTIPSARTQSPHLRPMYHWRLPAPTNSPITSHSYLRFMARDCSCDAQPLAVHKYPPHKKDQGRLLDLWLGRSASMPLALSFGDSLAQSLVDTSFIHHGRWREIAILTRGHHGRGERISPPP
jgi:hypothetical protein